MKSPSVEEKNKVTETDIIIVGAGFSGLGMGVELKKSGRNNFIILEQAGAVGGVWRDNVYPGCACDIPSPLYSFSFNQSSKWSRLFAPAKEIQAYMVGCAETFELNDHIQFNSAVQALHYDEETARWDVVLADGRQMNARIVIMGIGGLNRPAHPNIPGLKDFRGPVMHSAEWDADVDLKDKRVAVVGTGASAIQIVPSIQPEVAKLDLYQRSPPWVMPKPDREIEPQDRAWFGRNMWAQNLIRKYIFAYNEVGAIALNSASMMKSGEAKARAHIASAISDPELRDKVTPDYVMGCKRILISDDYYPALAQENTSVITDPIVKITASGVVTGDGVEHPADVIALCTGFKVQETMGNMDITGLGGRKLAEDWSDGAEGYYGVATAGYPNLFFLVGPNSGLGHNSIVYVIETHTRYIAECLDWMAQDELASIAVNEVRHREFNRDLQDKLGNSVWNSGCDSWYSNDNGKITAIWPGFAISLNRSMRKVLKQDFNIVRLEKLAGKSAL